MLIKKFFLWGFSAALLSPFVQAMSLNSEKMMAEPAVTMQFVIDNYNGLRENSDNHVSGADAYDVNLFDLDVLNKNLFSISTSAGFDFNGLWPNRLPVMAPASVVSAAHMSGLITLSSGLGVETYFTRAITKDEFSGGQYFAINDFTFNKRSSSVPDPNSFFLLGIGIIALVVARQGSAA